jgi:hypothetical protein
MSKLVRPKYLVSSDSIGFLGKPEQFIYLWEEFFENGTIDGVEAIAFKPIKRLQKLSELLKKINVPILSFHGKTGGEDQLDLFSKIIMTAVNSRIVDSEIILQKFPDVDFLSHGPYFEKESTRQTVLKYQPKKIWIENHLRGKRGVEDAIRQINIYRSNKIDASGMLDIYHYIADNVGEINTDWPNLVGEMESYMKKRDKTGRQFFTGIHFPIGSRLGDSLPIDNMTDQMLELFAKKIIPYVDRVVFENQQANLGLFFSTKGMIENQKKRNTRIIERLKKTGIIK